MIYEMVQNGPPEMAQQGFPFPTSLPDVNVDPFFTNPFFGGFAVGTQTKIMNAGSTYWQDNPTGIWKIGFMRYTQLAFDVLANPGLHPDNYAFLNDMRTTNGVNSQGALSGMPLIVCRGPIRMEAMTVYKEMGISHFGILLSEKDSIVYPRCLAPEIRTLRFPDNIHSLPETIRSKKTGMNI